MVLLCTCFIERKAVLVFSICYNRFCGNNNCFYFLLNRLSCTLRADAGHGGHPEVLEELGGIDELIAKLKSDQQVGLTDEKVDAARAQ